MRILFGGQDVQTCAIGLVVLRHDPRSSRRHRPTELLLLIALQEGRSSDRAIHQVRTDDRGRPLWDAARRACPSIAPLQEAPLTGKPHRIALDQTEPTDRVTRYQDSHR